MPTDQTAARPSDVDASRRVATTAAGGRPNPADLPAASRPTFLEFGHELVVFVAILAGLVLAQWLLNSLFGGM